MAKHPAVKKKPRNSEKRRVVVTGLGVCSPLGNNVEEFWKNLLAGKSAVRDVTDTYPFLDDYKVKIGALFTQEKIKEIKQGHNPKRMDLFSMFALDALDEAISDAELSDNSDETGISIGTGIGGLAGIEEQYQRSIENGLDRISNFVIPKSICDAAPGNASILHKFHATESPALVSACAAGASSIKFGYMSIIQGDAKIMPSGGSEAAGTRLGYGGFGNMKAISSKKDIPPEQASCPFDKGRSGFVLGEGAGIIVLEDLKYAKAREAKIYAELLSYGSSSDGNHITAPDETGDYPAKAIKQAIERAKQKTGLDSLAIDYINAHGTSTPYNDKIETMAIKKALGEKAARKVAISSTKSMLGHTLGAAGGLEALITIKAIQEGKIPPTINLKNPDPECDLDYTPYKFLEREVNYALSNSFGFFGHNVVLLFGKYKE